jgi:hypothetical protein
MVRTAKKASRKAVLLLRVCSLTRERVYRSIAWQRPFRLAPLFRISGVISHCIQKLLKRTRRQQGELSRLRKLPADWAEEYMKQDGRTTPES